MRGEERGDRQHAEKDFTCTRRGEQLKRKRRYEITQSSPMAEAQKSVRLGFLASIEA